MNINPINQSIPNATSFEGKIITKGKWPEVLREEFTNHYAFRNIEKSNYNIIGKMKTTKSKGDVNHMEGQKLYKLVLSAQKEKPTLSEKILYFLGLTPKIEVTRHYHSYDGMSRLMLKRIKPESLKNGLDIIL